MPHASTDWRTERDAIDDATYLDTASRGPIPCAAVRAVLDSMDLHRRPHRVNDSTFFETPSRLRTSLAALIGARPAEIALTTGAGAGMAPWRSRSSGSAATRSSRRSGGEVS
jgi:kynureninase